MAKKTIPTPREYTMPNDYQQGGFATYNPQADRMENAQLIGEDILRLKAKREQVQKELDDLKVKRQNFDILSVNVPEKTEDDNDNIQAQQFLTGAEALMEYDPGTAQGWLLRSDEIEARKQARAEQRAAGTSPTAIRQQLRMARDRAYESYKNDKLSDNVREISRQEMLLLTAEMAKPNPSDVEVYAKIDALYTGKPVPHNGGDEKAQSYGGLSSEISNTIGAIKYKGKDLDDAQQKLLQKINASGLSQSDIDRLKSELELAVSNKGNAPKPTDVRADAQKAFSNIKAVAPTIVKQADALKTRVDGINATLANFTTNPGQSYYMGLKKQLGDAIGGADFAGLTSFGLVDGLISKAKAFANASPVSEEQAKREVQGFISSVNASVREHNKSAETLIRNSKETNQDGIQLFRDNYTLKELAMPAGKSSGYHTVPVPTAVVKKGTVRYITKDGVKRSYKAKRDLNADEAKKLSNYDEVK